MNTRPITRAQFPLGQPVIVETIIDGACGWEYDAPLHIIRPFHLYRVIGSCCKETVDGAIEDVLIDLDVKGKRNGDVDFWPYSREYLDGLASRARHGRGRNGVWFFRSSVTVNGWGDEFGYEVNTIEPFNPESAD